MNVSHCCSIQLLPRNLFHCSLKYQPKGTGRDQIILKQLAIFFFTYIYKLFQKLHCKLQGQVYYNNLKDIKLYQKQQLKFLKF